MHDDLRHLDLTFPAIPVGGKETPPSLRRLLYKGGASIQKDKADQAITGGLFGDVQRDRIDLVRLAHECINGNLSSRTIFAVKVRLAMQQGLSDEALGVERGRAAYAA